MSDAITFALANPYLPIEQIRGRRLTMTLSLLDRFTEKASTGDVDECWPWLAARTPAGYGVFGIGRQRLLYAHRVAYLLQYGEMPEICRHACDNPPCVNPFHLASGTQADNVADMMERKRHASFDQTHCIKGHPLYGDNLYVRGGARAGQRRCRTCELAAAKIRNARKCEESG